MNQVVANAIGYEAYNNLIYPMFSQDFVTRLYPQTIAGRITSRDIVPAEITKTGDHVIFRRAPTGQVHDYARNQILEVGRLNTVNMRIDINRGKYYNFKLDKVDQTQIQDVEKWVDGWIFDAQQKVAQAIDLEVFETIAVGAHPANKGRCAGATSGQYDMGTFGAPIELTPSNVLTVINDCSSMLSEANVDYPGRFFVAPTPLQSLLTRNQVLSQAYASGNDKSIQLFGAQAIAGPIGGFDDFMFSNVLPRRWDSIAGKWCYTIPFGMPDATAYIGQLSENEIINQDKEAFAHYWRGLYIYGMGVLRSEALGVLYCYINPKG